MTGTTANPFEEITQSPNLPTENSELVVGNSFEKYFIEIYSTTRIVHVLHVSWTGKFEFKKHRRHLHSSVIRFKRIGNDLLRSASLLGRYLGMD